jgi:catechol 2,3-dioxygenase-like lactoylglutathione lyase family enzyme
LPLSGSQLRNAVQVLGARASSNRASKLKGPAPMRNLVMGILIVTGDRNDDRICPKAHAAARQEETKMFADHPATALVPAKDIERAKRWYTEKLGLTPSRDSEYGAGYALSGVTMFLYPTEFAGTAQHTLLSFNCKDLVADMKAMRANGVVFLDYDMPNLKTENGLASWGTVKNAWCKDSEGNILGFVEGM